MNVYADGPLVWQNDAYRMGCLHECHFQRLDGVGVGAAVPVQLEEINLSQTLHTARLPDLYHASTCVFMVQKMLQLCASGIVTLFLIVSTFYGRNEKGLDLDTYQFIQDGRARDMVDVGLDGSSEPTALCAGQDIQLIVYLTTLHIPITTTLPFGLYYDVYRNVLVRFCLGSVLVSCYIMKRSSRAE